MMGEWALTNVAMTASPLEADQHIQTHELDIIHNRTLMMMVRMMMMMMMVMLSRVRRTNLTYSMPGS